GSCGELWWHPADGQLRGGLQVSVLPNPVVVEAIHKAKLRMQMHHDLCVLSAGSVNGRGVWIGRKRRSHSASYPSARNQWPGSQSLAPRRVLLPAPPALEPMLER